MLGTEKVFADALIFLAESKPLKEIRITELLTQAKGGRQTFYNHFEDKYDLVRWIYSDYGGEIDSILSCSNNMTDVFKSLFLFFADHKHFFSNIKNISSQDEFIKFLSERLTNYYSSLVVRCHGEAYLTNEVMFAIGFNCDGFSKSCWRWMCSGMSAPPEIMANRMINNMSPVLRKMTRL